MGLDSIYAMTAVPARVALEKKRVVDQVKKGDGLAPDSHEAPQSQLPPHLERRKPKKDRRQSADASRRPRVDRRLGKGRREGENVIEEIKRSLHIDVMA
ncbi:hypothetical protein [Shewanella gelidii]|uniref:Uncharacterized protein n=1 Tax=Shewanella gelidii TaxID=1642821 RepID=A0A917NC56_9GAMM|nr:hypothetical protein [Shewanella gelidii]MCL1098386.1 hypothetical protein [Shewanella gelidii]GGI83122.1 hypothetical protein GCM10009332_20520 [Shewanella gelidii]